MSSKDAPRTAEVSLYDAAGLAEAGTADANYDALERRLRASGVPLVAHVEQLLNDPHVAPDVWGGLACLLERCATADLRGAVGLVLIMHDLDEASRVLEPAAPVLERCSDRLTEPSTRDAFREFYRLPDDYALDSATFYKLGTTSFILECRRAPTDDRFAKPQRFALKCLLPRYLLIRSIRQRTLAYKHEHGAEVSHAPQIYESTERYIAMDLVVGDTLAERFALHRSKRRTGGIDFAFVRAVGVTLCTILGELHQDRHHHLDLSPSNIIVGPDDALDLTLVDFGHNFAITEKVSSNAATKQAMHYIAPELFDDTTRDDAKCDMYSLGVILLEAAADANQDLGKAGDDSLSMLWERAPGIARIVEDLIDDKPEYRLLLADEETAAIHIFTSPTSSSRRPR